MMSTYEKDTTFSPERLKVLVMDVDDTVTRNTLQIKTDVWDEIFSDELERLQEARELFEYTGAGDRYNMIAHVIGQTQDDCTSNPAVIEVANMFEAVTQRRIREQGIHPDDRKAILNLSDFFGDKVYLLSATPQASVEQNINFFIKKYPELEGVFKAIIGTPLKNGKAGALQDIADENNLAGSELLMVGDGDSDLLGARGAGTQFVGIVPRGKKDKWQNERFPKIASISELPGLFV